MEEYKICWEDSKFRTENEWKIFTVYFAITSILFYIISQDTTLDNFYLAILLSLSGFLFTNAFYYIIIGERRPWSADVLRISQIERIWSNSKPFKHRNYDPAKPIRISEYEKLWRDFYNYQEKEILEINRQLKDSYFKIFILRSLSAFKWIKFVFYTMLGIWVCFFLYFCILKFDWNLNIIVQDISCPWAESILWFALLIGLVAITIFTIWATNINISNWDGLNKTK